MLLNEADLRRIVDPAGAREVIDRLVAALGERDATIDALHERIDRLEAENTHLSAVEAARPSGSDAGAYARTRELADLAEVVRLSGRRIPGLNKGLLFISDDFDAPLPDDFWLGE